MSSPPKPLIRPATLPDLPSIHAIYTHAVLHGTGTFDEVPPTLEYLTARWKEVTDRGWPWLVAELPVGPSDTSEHANYSSSNSARVNGDIATVSPAITRSGVAGYAYSAQFRDRSAYRHTAETSIYISPLHTRSGIASALLEALIDQSRRAGFVALLAVIGDSHNLGSIGLHQKYGFEHVGVIKGVGRKMGRWLDVVWMQRDIRDRAEVEQEDAEGPTLDNTT